MNAILVTSNNSKLREFKRFGLDLSYEKGKDISEVDGTIDDVIIYKALAAGKDKIVEDTILEVDGEEIVDIRWKINQMDKEAEAKWIVSLGYNDGTNIKVYRGIIIGNLHKSDKKSEFGFDVYFTPHGSEVSLAILEEQGQKDNFSARKIACQALLKDEYILKKSINSIPEWNGNYQH